MGGKWLELLKQIAPRLARVAVLRDAASVDGTAQYAAIQSAAPAFGVELTPVNLRDPGEIERAVGTLRTYRCIARTDAKCQYRKSPRSLDHLVGAE
jgi:hypothetical protein